MVVIDSPLSAQKYLRRISKDFSTVRRFSNTPNPNPNSNYTHTLSVPSQPRDALDLELPTTPRGIRKRQRLRKRSSVSSTLSKVLILNVRDLLKAQANNEDAARQEVSPTPIHPTPTYPKGSGIRIEGGIRWLNCCTFRFELGFSSSFAPTHTHTLEACIVLPFVFKHFSVLFFTLYCCSYSLSLSLSLYMFAP